MDCQHAEADPGNAQELCDGKSMMSVFLLNQATITSYAKTYRSIIKPISVPLNALNKRYDAVVVSPELIFATKEAVSAEF